MSGLPRGWVEATFGQVTKKIGSGATPTGGEHSYKASGIPLIRSLNIHFDGVRAEGLAFLDEKQAAKLNNVVVEADDVLLNITGASIGRVAVAPSIYTGARVNQHVSIIRLVQEVLPQYIRRFLASPAAQDVITRENYGATRQALTKSMIEEFAFPLPPLAEQKRIVAKLDALSAKSARARTELARIETLVSRYKQAVLSKAFRGELTTSQRSIPMSRVEVRDMLSDLAQGWSPKCEKISASSDEQWAVITTTAIQSFSFQPNENKILPAELSPREHLVIKKGDVLITRAGPRVRCGVCCYVERTRPRLMLCDKAYRLRLKNLFDPKFFVFLMNSPELLSRIEDMKTGGNDSGLNLTQERFTSLVLPTWPLDVQHEIVRRIESAFAKIDRLAIEAKRALKLLGKLDEAILAKAFRGELVPQDGNDEPAEHLLERIRAEREAAPKATRGRGMKG